MSGLREDGPGARPAAGLGRCHYAAGASIFGSDPGGIASTSPAPFWSGIVFFVALIVVLGAATET